MKKLKYTLLMCSIFLLCNQHLQGFAGTKNIFKDSTGSFGIYLCAGTLFNKPTGILSDRFNTFWGIPIGLTIKDRNNFYYHFEHIPLVGSQVTEPNLFNGLTGATGLFLDINGNPAVIRQYMRGFMTQFQIGREFIHFGKKKKSSLGFGVGAGFLQHRIELKFDRGNIPQIEGTNEYGFDRLTAGFLLSQNIIYRYVNPSTMSLYATLNFNQGFTKNKRNWNNGENNTIYNSRLDLFPNLGAGIIIPLKFKEPYK